jgi:tRNA pseudouridine55 synthase
MNANVNGLLLVDKPTGWTSHDLVDWARRQFETRAIGHCGTLDPMASGLMVLLIGEATKLSNYILEKDKAYRVDVQLGITTDTLDTTGAVLQTHPVDYSQEHIAGLARSLEGEFILPVPMYSAVKVGGVKLHEMARKNEKIEQPEKSMKFWNFEITELKQDSFSVAMACSKGSYVRSWVHMFGEKLGCGAAMSGLVRTSSAPYRLSQAFQVEQIEKWKGTRDLAEVLIPMTEILPEYRCLRVQPQDERLLTNGQISNGLKSQLISAFRPGVDVGFKILSSRGQQLMALIGLEEGKGFVVRRGFRY